MPRDCCTRQVLAPSRRISTPCSIAARLAGLMTSSTPLRASTRRATGGRSIAPDTCVNNTTPPLTDASYCQRDNYSLFQPQREFFKQAINNNDQLRQRMAWAWSQFFVISGN